MWVPIRVLAATIFVWCFGWDGTLRSCVLQPQVKLESSINQRQGKVMLWQISVEVSPVLGFVWNRTLGHCSWLSSQTRNSRREDSWLGQWSTHKHIYMDTHMHINTQNDTHAHTDYHKPWWQLLSAPEPLQREFRDVDVLGAIHSTVCGNLWQVRLAWQSDQTTLYPCGPQCCTDLNSKEKSSQIFSF